MRTLNSNCAFLAVRGGSAGQARGIVLTTVRVAVRVAGITQAHL
jgi:hypothetical protein